MSNERKKAKAYLNREAVKLPRMRLQLLAVGDRREPTDEDHPAIKPRAAATLFLSVSPLLAALLWGSAFSVGSLRSPTASNCSRIRGKFTALRL